MWIRTCQECGHKQKDKMPQGLTSTTAYDNRLCKKCKSMGLDYGYEKEETEEKD